MYTVQELIDKLKECDPEDDVMISYADKGKTSTGYSLRDIDVIVFSKKRLAVVLSSYGNIHPDLWDEPRL